MGSKTSIIWTESSWNPVSGCTKVSPGCDHCYAEKVAQRFAGTKAYPDGFAVTLWPSRLDQPLRWTRPRKIFVNSMGDLFHDEVPEDFVAGVFAVMAAAPRHTFQLLTKRHARMRSLVSSPDFREKVDAKAASDYDHDTRGQWPLPNLWLGVSAENQMWADIRIPVLLDTPAVVRFVSAEPLIGPITDIHAETLDWVIVGGHETGRLLNGRTWDGYPSVSGGGARSSRTGTVRPRSVHSPSGSPLMGEHERLVHHEREGSPAAGSHGPQAVRPRPIALYWVEILFLEQGHVLRSELIVGSHHHLDNIELFQSAAHE